VFTWNSTQFDGNGPVSGIWDASAGGLEATITNENAATATVRPASVNRHRFVNMSCTPCYLKGVGLTTGSARPKVTALRA
jgi:hypothetical protein